MGTPILRISDGIDTISLLSSETTGIFLDTWRPAIAGAKSGGVFQSSSLSEGRQLAVRMFANATETINFKAGELSQNLTIVELRKLIDLLEKAIDYSTGVIQQNPVYLEAKAACEDNSRYTLIVFYQWKELNNPYAQPFYSPEQIALMDDLTLNLERQHWLSNAPGNSECVLISSVQEWQYQEFWETNTTLPTGMIYSLLQTTNGYIYAGEQGDIFRSIDNGANWANNTTQPASQVYSLLQTTNGYIYAGDFQEIWRSIDNGASWSSNTVLPSYFIRSMLQTANGYIYAGDGNQILRSIDNGASWGVNTTLPIGEIYSLLQTTNGYIYAGSRKEIFRSIDDGINWSLNSTLPIGNIEALLQTNNGYIFAADETFILRSIDNGENWHVNFNIAKVGSWFFSSLIQVANGDIYAGYWGGGGGTRGGVKYSTDYGESWNDSLVEGNYAINSLLQTTNEDIYAGLLGEILRAKAVTIQMGRNETCTNEVYISNKQNIGNLTHIKIDDGSVFTDILPSLTDPQLLFPATPVINDAIYFGQSSAITNTGPFCSLVFDLIPITFTSSYTIIWEYSDGAAGWPELTVQDNTFTSEGAFRDLGVSSVHWEPPTDWTVETIDGIGAFWIRARLSALAGSITPPSQQNREIYTINQPFINIASTVINGEIPALLRQKLQNQSDKDGRTTLAAGTHTGANNVAMLTDATATFDTDGVNVGMIIKNTTDGSVAEITAFTATTITGTLAGGTDDDWDTNDAYEVIGLNLFENRIICGLRSYSRGSTFQAYLNISDEQNPDGIIVTATGADTTFVDDTTTPTGRKAIFTPVSLQDATQITISLSSTIAQHFNGKFHVFLRVQRVENTSSSVTAFDIKLQFVSSSGGVEETTTNKQVQTVTQWELLDFGSITLPVGGQTTSTDLGDITEIRIIVEANEINIDLNLYDLILIPVDEWAGDFWDLANNDNSIIGQSNNIPKLLDIDSVSNSKVNIQTYVRTVALNQKVSTYEQITPNKSILQANIQQRLWILAAQSNQTGTLTAWIAPPEIAHSVQVFNNERWLTMRGDK